MSDFPNILDTPASSGGGAYELIDTQNVTNVSSMDFGNISQAYNSLMLVINGLQVITTNTRPWMRFSTDGGSTFLSTAIYSHETYGSKASATSLINQINLYDSGSNMSLGGIGYSGVIHINNYNDDSGLGVISMVTNAAVGNAASANTEAFSTQGSANVGAAINGIRILMSSGNLTGIGRLYGLT